MTVPRVSDGRRQPRWSVLIPTYNCAQYVGECLSSVLEQDAGPEEMEIIVMDDCSTDDVAGVVKRIGGSRVKFVSNKVNVGKVENFNNGLTMSRGVLIHQLHGDDRVSSGFYSAMDSAFEEFPSAGAFFCQSRYISESGAVIGKTAMELPQTGLLGDWLESIVVAQRVQTPSMVVRRSVYEELGGFDSRLDMVEDWEMWIRIASRFPIGFVAADLADYRLSSTGTSASFRRSGRIASRLQSLFEVVDEYLPPNLVARVRTPRAREAAQYVSQLIPELMQSREYHSVLQAFADTLHFSLHPRTVYRLLYFTARYPKFIRQ